MPASSAERAAFFIALSMKLEPTFCFLPSAVLPDLSPVREIDFNRLPGIKAGIRHVNHPVSPLPFWRENPEIEKLSYFVDWLRFMTGKFDCRNTPPW